METEGLGEGIGAAIGEAIDRIVVERLTEHRELVRDVVAGEMVKLLELSPLAVAVPLLDIEVRRAELRDADEALRRGEGAAAEKARAAILAADDLLRRMSNAIVEKSRAVGAAVTVAGGALALHVVRAWSESDYAPAVAGAAVTAARAALPFC